MKVNLGTFEGSFSKLLKELKKNDVLNRIWQKDYTVWKPSQNEISNRLDWLTTIDLMKKNVPDIQLFVKGLMKEGFQHVLLIGMGGSSLAAEVFRNTFAIKKGFLALEVLDSIHPEEILSIQKRINFKKTLFVISTKSGSTLETLSLLKYFFNLALKQLDNRTVGDQFIAITDPGSSLEKLSEDLKFRKVFLNDPNIGGRFSALSYFGLIPAGLMGVDLNEILNRAQSTSENCREFEKNPAINLGISLGLLAKNGFDKIHLCLSKEIESFGDWIEQLIAESTGKEKLGILPVLRNNFGGERHLKVLINLKNDRNLTNPFKEQKTPYIQITLNDSYDLGGQFFLWEMATAVCGTLMKINPFDQPNVESSKAITKRFISEYGKNKKKNFPRPAYSEKGIDVYCDGSISNFKDGFIKILHSENDISYVAIQAFLPKTKQIHQRLEKFQNVIQKNFEVVTTIGYGPRYLHSTGQLHKGDSGKGRFIQISAEVEKDLNVPDHVGEEISSIGFGSLLLFQAMGDYQALLDAKRKIIQFHIQKDLLLNLDLLLKSVIY